MDIHAFITELGTLVVALIIVLDPLGALPILVTLESCSDRDEKRSLIYKVIGGATILLLVFIFTGTGMLSLFNITLDDMRIGGGLLLVIIALNLVVHGRVSAEQQAEEYRAAVVPLISPLLIGPGAITAAVVLATIHGVWITTLAAFIAMFLCLLIFMATGFIHRIIGDSGTALVSRLMGVLIVTIGVSYIRIGVLHLIVR